MHRGGGPGHRGPVRAVSVRVGVLGRAALRRGELHRHGQPPRQRARHRVRAARRLRAGGRERGRLRGQHPRLPGALARGAAHRAAARGVAWAGEHGAAARSVLLRHLEFPDHGELLRLPAPAESADRRIHRGGRRRPLLAGHRAAAAARAAAHARRAGAVSGGRGHARAAGSRRRAAPVSRRLAHDDAGHGAGGAHRRASGPKTSTACGWAKPSSAARRILRWRC